jgi:hypothetical protein
MPIHLKIIVDNISGKCKSTKFVLALNILELTDEMCGISILYSSALLIFTGEFSKEQHLDDFPLLTGQQDHRWIRGGRR